MTAKGQPSNAATLAAWQTFFLVVPVASTTFASLDKLFVGLGRESLGWLFVDEAGQAPPQYAVGALWRARRAVIVGDPLQLKPVVTLPWGGQRALLSEFGVDEQWAPSRTSVQQVADRLAEHGTTLPGPASDEPVWVGTPLRVHRRCDRPMFVISNQIAYDGLMVFGTPDRPAFGGRDVWCHITSATPARAGSRPESPICSTWPSPAPSVVSTSSATETPGVTSRTSMSWLPASPSGTQHPMSADLRSNHHPCR